MAEIEFNKDGSVSRKRLHSGNQPSIPRSEECHVCAAKFTRLNHLKRHLLTHTDSRRHECERCHFQFTRRDLLTKHSRICGKPKIRSHKSRRRSCAPCALAKCKCDLQQPCSCCVAKKRECVFTDTKTVAAVELTPTDAHETECATTPSASSDIIFTPDDLISPNLKSRVPGKHDDGCHPPDVSAELPLTAPLGGLVTSQDWLGDGGQFPDQFSSSYLQDIFFDWSVPPGCNPLDFSSTFSPMYASVDTTPFGVVSDPTHILTPSAYLEPANTHQSAANLKRYFDTAVRLYSSFLPVLHFTWRKDGKSPLLLTFMQAAGAFQTKSRESREFLRFAIEDMTPVLTREITRSTSDAAYQSQLLAAYLCLLTYPLFQIPTRKLIPCPWLAVVSEAIKEMIYRKALINDVVAWQLFPTYPLTASALQDEWVRWAEHESRKRLLWALYCFDGVQVLYFGGRPSYHISSFPVPLPCENPMWYTRDATTWLSILTSESQYGHLSDRMIGSSIVDKLHALKGDWDAPLPFNIWELSCTVVAITVELESCLYQRHKTESETRYLFDLLPGPTQITLFGEDMPTSTARKMLRNWLDSFVNCTEFIYDGWQRVDCAFQDVIHLWYISQVFLDIYVKPTNEFKYNGTRTANAVKAWLSKNLPRRDKGSFVVNMGNLRFQNMDFEPQQEEC